MKRRNFAFVTVDTLYANQLSNVLLGGGKKVEYINPPLKRSEIIQLALTFNEIISVLFGLPAILIAFSTKDLVFASVGLFFVVNGLASSLFLISFENKKRKEIYFKVATGFGLFFFVLVVAFFLAALITQEKNLLLLTLAAAILGLYCLLLSLVTYTEEDSKKAKKGKITFSFSCCGFSSSKKYSACPRCSKIYI